MLLPVDNMAKWTNKEPNQEDTCVQINYTEKVLSFGLQTAVYEQGLQI